VSSKFRAVARRSGGSSSGTRSRSKKSLRAAEQERADVARARRRWMREQGLFDPARLVFIDETSANTKMVRLYGRCARGERLVDLEPHGHWKTITFVAALRQNGMTAPCTIDGAMNGGRFLTYVERCRARIGHDCGSSSFPLSNQAGLFFGSDHRIRFCLDVVVDRPSSLNSLTEFHRVGGAA
jgi:hypothetical protein